MIAFECSGENLASMKDAAFGVTAVNVLTRYKRVALVCF